MRRFAGIPLALSLLVAPPARAEHGPEIRPSEARFAGARDDDTARERYAKEAFADGRFDDAIAVLADGVARSPRFRRGYYLLAVAYRAKGAWTEAADYFRICLALDQQPNDSLYGLGRVLAAKGDRDGARRALRAYVARERDPTRVRYVEEARRQLVSLGDTDERESLAEPDLHTPTFPAHGPRDRDDLISPAEPEPVVDRGAGWAATQDPFAVEAQPLRDLHDPFVFSATPGELPGAREPGLGEEQRAALVEYARAMAAFRHSLALQAERTASGYERGLSLAIGGRGRDAVAAWDAIALEDDDVAQAKRRLVRARARLAR